MRFSRSIILLPLLLILACQVSEDHTLSSGLDAIVPSEMVASDSVILRPAEGLVYYQGKPFSGTAASYYSEGILSGSIDFVQGKRHGFYRKWFEDGTLSFESQYQDGKQHGLTSTWWRNGNKRTESAYHEGIPHGIQLQWYTSGVLFKKMNLEYGKEEGLQQSWRENGKIYNNYEARNGRIFGLKRSKLCFSLEDETIQYAD